MKKKIFSVLASIMLLLCPFVLSACGDRYENMEFHISYAFSEDSQNWLDATNGISITYGGKNDALKIDETLGYGTIYVKVEIANVKSKYIDDIIVTTSGVSSGLNFSTATVGQNQVFAIRITDNVKTNLRFFETNSGKSTLTSLNVSRSITGIEVNTSIKPAVVIGDTVGLALMQVDNLTYLPEDKTEQTSVIYSIDSVGGYVYDETLGANRYVATSSTSGVNLTSGGVLTVNNFTLTDTRYIVRIKATSFYNSEISAYFDVYILDRVTNADLSLYSPAVKYNKLNSADITDMTLYVGNSNYNTSEIVVEYQDFSSFYNTERLTIDGAISYDVSMTVDGQSIDFEQTNSINGLLINNNDGVISITAIDGEIKTNKLVFSLTLHGVGYFTSTEPRYQKEITLTKEILPTQIQINGQIYNAGDSANGIVYGTNANYNGLELTLSAMPLESSNDYVIIEGNGLNNLIIEGESIEYIGNTLRIPSGETIRIQFRENVSTTQSITIKVLSSPATFEGEMVTETNYSGITYTIDKIITADSINVYSNYSNGELSNSVQDGTLNIDARDNTSFYVQVYYDGTRLDASTITLYSSNEMIKFNNRETSISLGDSTFVTLVGDSLTDTIGKYNVYEVTFMQTASTALSNINIVAGDGNVGVNAEFLASSVYLLQQDSISLQMSNNNAIEFDPITNSLNPTTNSGNPIKYYAVIKDGYVEFNVLGRAVGSNAYIGEVIDSISLATNNDYSTGDFSTHAITYTLIPTNSFSLTGNIGGKTQVLVLTVNYYTLDNDVIVNASLTIQLEFAVYDPIQNISLNASRSDITYVNSRFENASQSEITIRSSGSNAIPASSVSFSNGQKVANASQLRLTFDKVLEESDNIQVSLSVNGETRDFNLADSGNGYILTVDENDILNGTIIVKLNATPNYRNLILSVQALRFGEESNVIASTTINFADYEYVEGVVVGGNSIVNEGIDSNYIYMSFMDVEENGFDEETFTATARYSSSQQEQGKLRFGDLTYVLYQVEQDENGQIVSTNGSINLEEITYSVLDIDIDENVVTIRANRQIEGGGGIFKLVIVPLDSYDDLTGKYDESKGTNLFIQLSDGTRQNPYIISSEEELFYINNDLNASYALGSDITVSGDFSSIGYTNGSLTEFNGTLVGSRQILSAGAGESGEVVNSVVYKIGYEVANSIEDTGEETSSAYAGLIAILGSKAVVSDINLEVKFGEEFTNTTENSSLYIGALAGVNNGTIRNVSLVVEAGTTDVNSLNGTYFGGLVGANNNIIELSDSSIEFGSVEINLYSDSLTAGVVAGRNTGSIIGNYVDKEGLNDIVFNVISNLTINNYYSAGNSRATIYAGAISGENSNGVISNLLVGGQIKVYDRDNGQSSGYVGGIVGYNTQIAGENTNDKYIDSCTVIGLDILSTSTDVQLAGIAGSSSNYTISNVRVLSVNIKFSDWSTVGKIEGGGVVAGVVASSSNDTITNASVQNFVSNALVGSVLTDFYTLNSANNFVAGLVYSGDGTQINSSFVNANIAVNEGSANTIYLTSQSATENDTYFLGKVQGISESSTNIYANAGSDYNVVYSDDAMYIVSGKTPAEIDLTPNFEEDQITLLSSVDVNDILSEFNVDETSFETFKSSLYIKVGEQYEKLDENATYDANATYYTISEDAISKEIEEGLIAIDGNDNIIVIDSSSQFNPSYTYYNINFNYISVIGNNFVANSNIEELYIKQDNRYIQLTADIITGENLQEVISNLSQTFIIPTLDEASWIETIKFNNIAYENSILKENYAFTTNENEIETIIKNNHIEIQGLNYYFPYLVDSDGNALMIISPTSISANINEDYVVDIDSIYVENDIEISEIELSHSAIINYHNSNNPLQNERLNTYNLINTSTDDDLNGLIDLSVLPFESTAGVRFEIINGTSYAYINVNNEIVFTGVSGQTPIIVRAYSVFDDSVEAYVAFYTYLGFTDVNLSSNNIEELNNSDSADYELTTFVGSNPHLISIELENIYLGQECSTLFDMDGVENFVNVQFSHNENSIVEIGSTLAVDVFRLGIEENPVFDGNRWEENIEIILTFNLTEYFGENVYPQIENSDQIIEIGRVSLRVVVYKSATSVEINETGFEISTERSLNFNAKLYTGYVADSSHSSQYDIKPSIDSQGLVTLSGDTDNKDSITLNFEVVNGESEASRLLSRAEANTYAELFDYDFSWQAIFANDMVIGYDYNIIISLKDEFNFRYINSEIEFNLTISAWSNDAIYDTLLVTITPTTLNTARIENYTAIEIDSDNSYIDLIDRGNSETSIITPGGLGGVMLIYLQPAYSNIKSATLTSSSLYVPSLNRDVMINFEQLVYNTYTKRYQTILSAAEPIEGGIQLRLVSNIDKDGKESYNGVIYVHTQLDTFSGLSSTITATLTVETNSTIEPIKTVTKPLLTQYRPGANLSYDGEEIAENEYLIQEGTYSNTADITVYGYEFNSQPTVNLEWYLLDTVKYTYSFNDGKLTEEEFNEKFDYLFTLSNGVYVKLGANATYDANVTYYEPANRGIIYDVSDTDYSDPYYISDYVTNRIVGNFADLEPNADGSYTLQVLFNVYDDIPASFKLTANQSLTTSDSIIITERSESLIFHPVKAILNELYFGNLNNNTMNLVINYSNSLDFEFVTDGELTDLNDYLYSAILNAFRNENNELDRESRELFVNQFYFVNDSGSIEYLTLNETEASIRHPQFRVNAIEYNDSITISLRGVETFNRTIYFSIQYGYIYNETSGKYEIKFGTMSQNSLSKSLEASFNLIITPSTTEENAFPIYSADDMVNEDGSTRLVEGTDYILMNDITLDLVQPIDVAIASFDGNNRVITINSFAVSSEQTNYGLFASIGTYTRNDGTHKTILKNIIVNYGNFNSSNNGILSLVGLSDVTFGGLVAVNNGGLIYNCDVMNLTNTTKTINIVTDSEVEKVTFGGLVGENNGTITNSRVGRMSYTRIEANEETQSERTVYGEALTFVVGDNSANVNESANGFVGVSGGFVGTNGTSGVVASSYMANTSLINLSTADSLARTAGFAGVNNGTINYSYVKAREDTISYENPNSTGASIRAGTNGNVAGFVHVNSGTITNSFANTELITTSAFMAGFVYQNNASGVISECYSACTLNGTNNTLDVSEQPFVGIDEAGVLLSDGTIENSYFLISNTYSEIEEQEGKDQAQALNSENFMNSEQLNGFVFINSTSSTERNQGVWTYYSGNLSVVLPELTNANLVAHSYRYFIGTTDEEDYVVYNYTNAVNYEPGSANNPHIIRNVDEFNEIMTQNSTETNRSMTGYVRFVDNIDFASDSRAIQTRVNFTLGDVNNRAVTSIEGNGMTISGIYLDVLDATSAVDIGLFARVENAYIKNLNLNFVSTSQTDDQFSSVSVQNSGGLAGRINNSAIINISLDGSSTTIAGKNFAGGLAGRITGSSLIYGIDSNLSVRAVNTDSSYYLYYNEADFNTMKNIGILSYGNYDDYVRTLSYAGGIAGVVDITERENVEFNFSYINVLGTEMYDRSNNNGNIQADYAGGVAGYINDETDALRVKFIVGSTNLILGQKATGGLFAVSMGDVTASQVSAPEETQYDYDTAFGKYVTDLRNGEATLDGEYGNQNLLEGYGYVGGLVGLSIGGNYNSVYSKASIKTGEVVGGLIGSSYSSRIVYSYAVPYINLDYNIDMYSDVAGLVGSAYGVGNIGSHISRNDMQYEAIAQRLMNISSQNTDVRFTFSTLLLDDSKISEFGDDVTFDYISADYLEDTSNVQYITSENSSTLAYVYSGLVEYTVDLNEQNIIENSLSNSSNNIDLDDLFDIYGDNNEQATIFYEVFSGWSEEYWTLDPTKYYPLLLDKGASNYIEIDSASDFEEIINNPDGYFKIINDINMSDWCNAQGSNYVLPVDFTGVLVGELPNGGTPTLSGLFINTVRNENSGFFRSTENSTIRNINFEWNGAYTGRNSIGVPSAVQINTTVQMFGGVSARDTGSLFTNLSVSVSNQETDKIPYMIQNANNSISGFGGIVGYATDSNILSCSFVGNVNATVDDTGDEIMFGGLVGSAERSIGSGGDLETGENENGYTSNMTILSSYVGPTSNDDGTISFTLTANDNVSQPMYVGGLVGYASNASISSARLGNLDVNQSSQKVGITINSNNINANVYMSVGGAIGYSVDSSISSSTILADVSLEGSQSELSGTAGSNINVAGLIGYFNQSGAMSNSPIRLNGVTADINLSEMSVSTLANVSLGVGYIEANTSTVNIEQNLFRGNVNTYDAENSISAIYYGGIVANADQSSSVSISESMAYVEEAQIGSQSTNIIYAGGIVGSANSAIITDSIAVGRIYPKNAGYIAGSSVIRLGGLMGSSARIELNRVISLVSIFLNNLVGNSLPYVSSGALYGFVAGGENNTNTITDVYYSSDLALTTQNDNVGYNIPVYTLVNATNNYNGNFVSNQEINLWSELGSGSGVSYVPYITSLQQMLINHSVLKPGPSGYQYNQGSILNPYVIENSNSSYDLISSTYAYYLISSNVTTLQAINGYNNGEINGFIIGGDRENDYQLNASNLSTMDSYTGIFANVNYKSAISNIHINLTSGADTTNVILNYKNVIGLIIGQNSGVAYNLSVQGIGLNILATASSDLGLIIGRNSGFASNIYSSAEILSTGAGLTSGLIAHNNGNLQNAYFTGYINNEYPAAGAGMIGYVEDGYVYNTYMAGVVENISEGGNSYYYQLYSNASATSFVGSKNYIDSLANIESINNGSLIATDTLNIMKVTNEDNEPFLDGNWYTVINSVTNNGVVNYYINPYAETYGYNYNYPILRDNKLMSTTTTENEWAVNSLAHQLYTGTGSVTSDMDDDKKDANLNVKLDINNFSNGATDTSIMNNVFKIPHLGVLSSIQGLTRVNKNAYDSTLESEFVSTCLNYMIIYDLDGINNNPNITTNWNAIGRDTNFGDSDLYYNVAGQNKFNGLLISNKNFKFTGLTSESESLDDAVTITNLSHNGLLTNINNAYIGYIKLGNFLNLENSGALGVTVNSTNLENIDPTQNNSITVANISFVAENRDNINQITGLGVENTTDNDNYIGALFGEITSGDITITNFSTIVPDEETASFELDSANSAGLIAGRMSGGTITIDSDDNANVEWHVKFGQINYAGGLIGQMSSGTINGGNTIINLHAGDEDIAVKMLGGLVGQTIEPTSESTVTSSAGINEVIVSPSISERNILYINSFGGLIGEANGGSVTIENCSIASSEVTNIVAKAQMGEGNNQTIESYFGLLVAKLVDGNVTISGFSHGGNNDEIIIDVEEASIESNSGYGVLVGKMLNGTIEASLGSEDGTNDSINTKLTVSGYNVGGIIGAYAGGKININNENLGNYEVEITGVTNVGGAIGLVSGNINEIIDFNWNNQDVDAKTYWNFLASEDAYATLITPQPDADFPLTLQNWGGLFGKFGKFKSSESSESSESSKPSELFLYSNEEGNTRTMQEIKNKNQININFRTPGEEVIKVSDVRIVNVGGVVGLFEGSVAANLINEGRITTSPEYRSWYNSIDDNKDNNIFLYENGGVGSYYGYKSINVGGVIGNIGGVEEDVYLYALKNNSMISGYQNVGGVIGNMDKGYLTSGIPNEINGKDYKTESGIYSDSDNSNYKFDSITDLENGNVYYDIGNSFGLYTEASSSDSSESNVYGVLNVGGAVGLMTGGTIDSILSQGNVYGNASVGGLVGYVQGSTTIRNSIVGANDGSEVKGVYFAQRELIINESTNTASSRWKYYVPTSVGGFIGTLVSSSEVKYNNVLDVLISSSEEGVQAPSSTDNDTSSTISTISNNMASLMVGDSQENNDYIKTDVPFDYSRIVTNPTDSNQIKKPDFNDIQTGFGGFIGSVNMSALANEGENNASTNNISVDIQAYSGVNVGTFYGYYLYDTTTSGTVGEQVLLPNLLDNVNISGAYNVGGVIGGLGMPETNDILSNFSNANIKVKSNSESATAKINIQPSSISVGEETTNLAIINGMYVGGLVGKLSGDASAVQIIDSNVNISIDTANSYYIGGLIGRLEGNLTKTEGDNIVNGLDVNGDNATNFGGLVGMLKVAPGDDDSPAASSDNYPRRTVTVEGTHTYPFTVNTIENSNYADGSSNFTYDKINNEYINLIAQAYYVNLDTFKISASQNVPKSSPLNSTAINSKEAPTGDDAADMQSGAISGWAKEYTTFRMLQRNIPKEDNSNLWDSIAVVYDAAKITKVGTIANLGLTNAMLLAENLQLSNYDPDYIVYTIYEETEGSPTLYSAIGIGTPVTNSDQSYVYPYSTQNSWWDNFWGTGSTEIKYIDLSNDNTDYINSVFRGLTYFDWSQKVDTRKVAGVTYHYFGGNREFYSTAIYSGEGTTIGGYVGGNYWENHNLTLTEILVYNVGYYNGTNIDTNDGVYFQFDVVYPNSTIGRGEKEKPSGDEILPQDGSIFNVNAVTASNYYNWIEGKMEAVNDSINGWSIAGVVLGALTIVGAILLTVATAGTAGLAFTGAIIAAISISAASGLAILLLGIAGLQHNLSMSSKAEYLQKLDQSYGFLSESYSTLINYKYENGQPIINNTDQKTIVRYGMFYTYYSSDRPNDYYERYYLYEDPTASDTTDASLTQIVLNNAGININGDDGRDLVITTSRPELPMTYTFTEDGTEHKGNIYRYYILYNGAYYKISIAAEVDYTTYQDSEYVEKQFPTVGERLTVSGSHYVRGNYNPTDNTYSYPEITDPNRKGNNLEYNKETGKFTANGETLPSDFTALYNIELNFYYDATINANVNKDNETDTTITTGSSWSEGVIYYRGYSYMKNAYYIADGQQNEEGLKKVAKFEYNSSVGLFSEGSAIWSNVQNKVYGEEGVDYFLVTVNNYSGGATLYALYQIAEIVDTTDETTYNYNSDILNLEYDREDFTNDNLPDLYVNIYPYSFSNPYNVVTTINESDLHDTNYYIVETMLTPDTEMSSVSISQLATFYYYEGGYTAFDKRDIGGEEYTIYEEIILPKNPSDSSNDLEYSDFALTVYNAKGEVDTTITSMDSLLKNWDYVEEHKNDLYITNPQLYVEEEGEDNNDILNSPIYKLAYNYHVDGGRLYKLSTTYVINNGLLSIAQILTNDSSQGYNFNKFLTDDSIQLYTRYKYLTEDLKLLDDISDDVLFKIIEFEYNETKKKYEKEVVGDTYKFPIPPYGGTYYFTESVSVSIGGGTVYLTFADASVDEDGNPIATEVRTGISTGGIVVSD